MPGPPHLHLFQTFSTFAKVNSGKFLKALEGERGFNVCLQLTVF